MSQDLKTALLATEAAARNFETALANQAGFHADESTQKLIDDIFRLLGQLRDLTQETFPVESRSFTPDETANKFRISPEDL